MGGGYTPKRLLLADALGGVMAGTGRNEAKCKLDICNAISDREVAVWVTITKTAARNAGETFGPARVVVPSRLRPDDFDWDKSCPKAPWPIEPTVPEQYLEDGRRRLHPIEFVQLSTDDLQRVGLLNRGLPPPRAPGVTGGPGAVDRFLRYFGANYDWYHLDPPEMDEALESYVARAILRHPAVFAVVDYGRLEPMTALGRVRPAFVTLPHWERGLANDEAVDREFMWDRRQMASAFRSRIVLRLWVEFFGQVAAKNLLLFGRFADDAEYQPRPVNPDLLQNRAMWLDPRGGLLGPDETGKGPHIGCLILREAAAGDAVTRLQMRQAALQAPVPGPAMAAGEPKTNSANADKRPFDAKEAMAQLAAKKVAGVWSAAPTEKASEAFLLQIFDTVPRAAHRKIRRELWRNIRRGPPAKQRPAN